MNVVELMSSPVCTCLKRDNLAKAAQIMWEQDCGALPVLDDFGGAVAMITDRDICMAAYTQGKPLSEIAVTTAASHHLTSVRPEDTVEFALSLMGRHQVHRLPVIDRGGNLIGLLSIADIIRSHCSIDGAVKERDFVQLARALDDVCRPHHCAVLMEADGRAPTHGRRRDTRAASGPSSEVDASFRTGESRPS